MVIMFWLYIVPHVYMNAHIQTYPMCTHSFLRKLWFFVYCILRQQSFSLFQFQMPTVCIRLLLEMILKDFDSQSSFSQSTFFTKLLAL